MNRLSFLFVLGIIVAVLFGATTGYVYVSKERLAENVKKYDLKIASLESDVVQYEGENLEAALSAKEALDFLGGDMVKWSEVISEILDTTPKDPVTKLPVVDYTSYSGSQGNRLSISVRTKSGSVSPYYDVAELIRVFRENPAFKNVFVPAISPGFTEEGDVMLTFNFNVEYVGGEAPAVPAVVAPAVDGSVVDGSVVDEPVSKPSAPSAPKPSAPTFNPVK